MNGNWSKEWIDTDLPAFESESNIAPLQWPIAVEGTTEEAEFLHNDRLLQQALSEVQAHKALLNQSTARERALAQVMERILETLEIDQIFQTATAEVRDLLYADRVGIYKFDPASNYIEGKFVAEDVAPEFASVLAVKVRDRCFGEHYATNYKAGHVLAIADVQVANLSDCHLQILTKFKVRSTLVVPLVHHQELWGLLCIHQCCGPRQWLPPEIDFVSRIASQLGLALQQTELYRQIQARSQDLQLALAEVERVAKQERTLTQIIECIRQTLDMQQIFATATTVVRQLLQADRVAIYRFEPNSNYLKGMFVAEDVAPEFDSIIAAWIPYGDSSSWSQSYFGESYINAYREGQVLSIADINNAEIDLNHFCILSRFKVYADLAIPLLQRDQLWGFLCVHQCCGPREWKQSEADYTSRIASQLGMALQQAQLFEQSRSRSRELQQALAKVEIQKEQLAQAAQQERTFAYVMRRIRQSLDTNHIFKVTTQEVRQILKCDRVIVYRFLPDWSGEFTFESAAPHTRPIAQSGSQNLWQDSYLQQEQGGRYRNLEASVTPDIYKANHTKCYLDWLESFQIRACMIVPIFTGETLWGLLGAYQGFIPREWQTHELRLFERVGEQLGIALQQAELMQQLQQAKEEADTANRSKSTFLSSMSHELRTPLNAILGFSQLMGRDPSLTPGQQTTLDIINRSGAHLLNLINDVLEMSKIEAGQTTLNTKDFDLQSLLSSLYDMLNLKAKSKGLQLVFDCATSVPQFISTDEGKLRQVLINLLGNAIKFTQQGCVTLRVQPDSPATSSTFLLRFIVTDTGPGIPAVDLETLFDPFTQTDVGRQSVEGTGLGLPISRNFVQLMGGDITMTSQLGQGTTIQFQIQARPATVVNLSAQFSQRVVQIAPNQPTYRILIAEDRLENRLLLVRLLESVGFAVKAVENGQDAIALWREWCPHLIWMDWQMPNMNGLEATRHIRQIEALHPLMDGRQKTRSSTVKDLGFTTVDPQYLPPLSSFAPLTKTIIIALTASIFEATREETLVAGCNDFVRKPFQAEEIFDKMATHLGVQYLYETPEVVQPQDTRDFSLAEAEQQLARLPHQCLSDLLQAAIELDEEALPEIIAEITELYPRLGQTLTTLADVLEFHKIADLAQRVLTHSPTT